MTYGSRVLEHFRRPRNRGPLQNASVAHEEHNALCGDRVRIELQIAGAIVTAAAFTASACALCTASASLLTERLRGLALAEAAAIDDADVLAALECDVPPGRRLCATLPLVAARRAMATLQDRGER